MGVTKPSACRLWLVVRGGPLSFAFHHRLGKEGAPLIPPGERRKVQLPKIPCPLTLPLPPPGRGV